MTLTLAIPETRLGFQRFKKDHMTMNTPLLGAVCHSVAMVNRRTKFEVSISVGYGDSKDDAKVGNGVFGGS